MRQLLKKCESVARWLGAPLLLSLLYWLILIYVVINDGALKNFRYMGF